MYNVSEYNIPKQAGWICPICGRVMAPTMIECIYCNKEVTNRDVSDSHTTDTPVKTSSVTTAHNTHSKCECHKENKNINNVVDTVIEPEVRIRKIDENGNLVDEKNMSKEELRKMDDILEKVLGDLVNTL